MNTIDERLIRLQEQVNKERPPKLKKLNHRQFQMMKNNQIGRCAICENELPEEASKAHVDHCHKTNKIRGILCFNCNVGLGHFKDNPNYLERAINYLNGNIKFKY